MRWAKSVYGSGGRKRAVSRYHLFGNVGAKYQWRTGENDLAAYRSGAVSTRSPKEDLALLESHFRFGENWRDFAEAVDEARILAAVTDLGRLVAAEELAGARLLDVGCGSGLSALAALRLGCAAVQCIDLDPQSLEAASKVLARFAPDAEWSAEERSVFDLDPQRDGRFDVVHSWGVLHHTGRMWDALDRTAAMVRPEGLLAVALYAKTPLCGFWRVEKHAYSAAPGWLQKGIRSVFKISYLAAVAATGRNPAAYVQGYVAKRGMSWSHDVHDWLGGYPYESAAPSEVNAFLCTRGFTRVRENVLPTPAFGIFGSPCNEYVFRREETD